MLFGKIISAGSIGLALLCFSNLSVAGQAPVVLPDSSSAGVGDTLAPSNDDISGNSNAVSTEITRNVTSNLRSIRVQRSVPTVAGDTIAVPEQTISLISDAMTATGGEVEPAIQALADQLGQELRGVGLEVSLLSNTTGDYGSAVAAMNDFIMGLNSQELALALESPTLMAVHRILSGKSTTTVPVSGETNWSGIIKISAR